MVSVFFLVLFIQSLPAPTEMVAPYNQDMAPRRSTVLFGRIGWMDGLRIAEVKINLNIFSRWFEIFCYIRF